MIKLLLLLTLSSATLAALDEVFAWNELTFAWPSEEAKENAVKSGEYVPENNLPLGLGRWKDKLFVTVPRWKSGVAASLNYISLSSANKTSPLTPYPSWKANTLPKGDEKPAEDLIVSTFRVKVDPCDRLWVMDTGLADIFGEGKQVSPQAIVVFDLKTDKLIRRYNLKHTDFKEESFFANIVVDVNPDKCDEAFAYIPDLGAYSLVVYSWAANDSWRVKHNFFHFDPLKGDFNVGGVNFQWTDGVFGLALGPMQDNGFRTMYFHPLASTREFSVSTQVLKNKTLATDPHNYYMFKIEGNRGDQTQASASDFDEKSNVLFLTQLNRDGVACWNPKKPLNSMNLALVVQDKEALIFTNDIKVDAERNLWILSDRMPTFLYRKLDPSQVNYRIFKANVDELIKNTACSV
ncbi:yellow-c precursor [Tribolium castaneum]|uniref:Protein yellow n=1 Tax=Tribolium castaneum TaxID=7070 RepID=D6X2Y2_TRICA|nr:yellow-c precursor [Tribolium castaneum]EFA10662.1 Protein yellow-like Protein [Tribolium castaneum]|eukprot:NP_001161778.1 yellow-c precursor [Tribolium castaneum]